MKKRLVTSALPYVNNIPHLGNLIQVLSADVFARFCREKGYETLYVCGTDEYGTATETRALEEGISPKELCDRYNKIHSDIYKWFNINFDKFGRTSDPIQTEITQGIFNKVNENGYIIERTLEQLYCESCERFLADRYVRGTCPHCGYEEARGDQCEDCGKLLDSTDLIEPKCSVCSKTPIIRKTKHLFLDLPGILPKLEEWIKTASVEGDWAKNAIKMTESWIRDGLKERCITRDLKWGIPVPMDGYRDKVFYVWFDAPIGYISITAGHTDDWEKWWKNPDEVELFQFIGKDNIPFHTVIFPSSLIASGENWTKLHHMSSTEYLNYESGKFSKSKGIGVFGSDAMESGIAADVWRFYIFYNRPEKSDALFTWKDFQEKVNSELIGNFSNLINRTLTFVDRFCDGKLPDAEMDKDLVLEINKYKDEITESFDKANLREALKKILALSSIGNKAFQEGEPWRTRTEDPEKTNVLLRTLISLVRDLAIMIKPFIPETSEKVAEFLSNPPMNWSDIGNDKDIKEIKKPSILFKKLEDKQIEGFREKYAGSQKERELEEAEKKDTRTIEEQFTQEVDIRVAEITAIERHPEADKLYVETIKIGEEERQIVSGLVPYYKEEELLGKKVLVVYNLKPAKLRGVKSQGMLLAAEKGDVVEVLFAENAESGERLVLEGQKLDETESPKRIKIDRFFDIPIKMKDYSLYTGDTKILCNNEEIKSKDVDNGEVG